MGERDVYEMFIYVAAILDEVWWVYNLHKDQ